MTTSEPEPVDIALAGVEADAVESHIVTDAADGTVQAADRLAAVGGPRRFHHRALSGLGSAADNGIYSLATVLIAVAAGRHLSERAFGEFSTASWIVTVLSLAIRQGVMESIGAALRGTNRRAGPVLGAGLLGAVPVSLVPLVALVVPGVDRSLVLASVAVTFLICVQDVLRYVAFFGDRVSVAISSDSACLLGGVVVVMLEQFDSPAKILAGWAGACAFGASVAWLLMLTRPEFTAGTELIRRLRLQVMLHSFDTIVNFGAFVGGMVIAAAVGGVEVASGLNGARILLTPSQVLIASFGLHIFRSVATGSAPVPTRAAAIRSLAFAAAIPVVYGMVVLALPESTLRQLFGDSAGAARQALPAFIVAFACLGGVIVAKLLLKIWHRSGSVALIAATSAPAFLILPALGVSTRGVSGAAAGVAVAFLIALAVALASVLRNGGPLESSTGDRNPDA